MFSPDGTLISASAAPHCGELERNPPIPNNIAEDDDGGNHSTSAGGAWQEPYLCVNAIKHSDKFVHFYTGLENYFVFLHAFWSLGDNVNHLKFAYSGKCDCISPENQFLLMLVKLRRHYPHTCLLYTSPSPRDCIVSRMPSSA